MSAHPAAGGRRLLASALGAAVDWLVEPAEEEERPAPERAVEPPRLEQRPVVAVAGLARRCGTTTVARALAAELATRDPAGTAAVGGSAADRAVPLGLPAANRLARTLAPVAGGCARGCGRICLVQCEDRAALAGAALYLAPLVLDVHEPAAGGAAASIADAVVLVGVSGVEPALADVVGESLARVGPRPVVVLNRGPGDERWASMADLVLPEARVGAGLALAGREAPGQLGRAVSRLADACEGAGAEPTYPTRSARRSGEASMRDHEAPEG